MVYVTECYAQLTNVWLIIATLIVTFNKVILKYFHKEIKKLC